MSIQWDNEDYLAHYGIPRRSGRYKWGSGKDPYHHGASGGKTKKHNIRSLSPKVMLAQRSNKKVDKSFDKWKEGAAARDKAISSGKRRNELELAYRSNPKDKSLKKEYKQANSQYKKDLKANTTYRKGTVRQEVGRDLSRKHLSAAKKSTSDKEYRQHMKAYETERAKARKAQEVGKNRSNRKAAIKRSMTKSMKFAVGAGVAAVAVREVSKHSNINISSEQVMDGAKKVRKFMQYVY